jgi:hypothetical protein
MKQVKTILTAVLTAALLSSCKKSIDVAPPPATGTRLSKIEFSGGIVQLLTYNANGRLASFKANGQTLKYNYAASPFSYEILDDANVLLYDIANAVFSSNRLTSYDFRGYNSSGVLNGAEQTSLQYDANGYQISKSYGAYRYTYTIEGGNTTGILITDITTGSSRNTTIEYYTDKLNKLNVNLFEQWYQDHVLSDMEVMGTKNTHLPKKVIYNSTTYTQVTEFVYDLNANGLVNQYTATITTNGGTPATYSANFTYQ